MKVVLDTSALIYLNEFKEFDELLTVPEVIKEVKDRTSKMKLSALDLKIVEPRGDVIKEIKNVARETGDLEKLSKTDVKLLALAKQEGCMIISDDRSIQNVAEKIGLTYVSLFSPKISKFIVWKKYCKNCRKYFENGGTCEICGSKLIRVPVSSKEINSRVEYK